LNSLLIDCDLQGLAGFREDGQQFHDLFPQCVVRWFNYMPRIFVCLSIFSLIVLIGGID
jgi:hypothetical protein